LDLGGIAKGYALDRAAALLTRVGISSALLDFGGQLLATAPPPDAPGWSVQLRDPRAAEGPHSAAEAAPGAPFEWCLVQGSLATSADDQRGRTIGGLRYSHLIDPRSALPAVGCVSASVFAPDGLSADALSSALFVLGPEARATAEARGWAAILIDATGATTTSALAQAPGLRLRAHSTK
jgi:thiamine biosynthesis lipoprotein